MSMAIDGLVSGMNTTDLVNQLMQAEALPQTALKNKVTTQNKVVSAYQSVNTKMMALATAAKALGKPDSWGSMKATSSSDAAVVSAQAGASAGSLSFRVESVATTQTMTFTGKGVDTPTAVVAGTTKSLNEIVAGINGDSTSLYKASAVQIWDDTAQATKYTLQVTAKTSGAVQPFDASKLPAGLTLADATTTVKGTDAQIRIGEDTFDTNGDPVSKSYTIQSKTNTFADVLPGLTITAARKQAAGDAPITINVAADADAVAAKVQTLVDSLNAALTEINMQTKGKTGTAAAGALVGDSAMRTLRQDLLSSVSRGVAGADPASPNTISSVADIGVVLSRDGTVSLNKEQFLDALAKDPAKTQRFFDSYDDTAKPGGVAGTFQPDLDGAQGLGRKLERVALLATGDTSLTSVKQGTLQGLIERRNDSIRALNDQVSNWDDRLALRREGLNRQFTGLETALGKMKQQSSWLSGQLASLS
jgi:flagellar hook-associated protein 2